jgi:hypothetical protein
MPCVNVLVAVEFPSAIELLATMPNLSTAELFCVRQNMVASDSALSSLHPWRDLAMVPLL